MTMDCWLNGKRVDGNWTTLRALHYGDGHFTTMRVINGRVRWWSLHAQRLRDADRRLHMGFDDWLLLETQVASAAAHLGDGVLKIIMTRSGGRRGYASTGSRHEWMMFADASESGRRPAMSLGVATTRLGFQPLLAGLKHLNRLEQVLARDEVPASRLDDLVLCDLDGLVIGTTSANIFVFAGGQWKTPDLTRAGIAGVCRAHLLSRATVQVVDVTLADLLVADEVFCCNAVRGIMPVARIGDRVFSPGPAIPLMMSTLDAEL